MLEGRPLGLEGLARCDTELRGEGAEGVGDTEGVEAALDPRECSDVPFFMTWLLSVFTVGAPGFLSPSLAALR